MKFRALNICEITHLPNLTASLCCGNSPPHTFTPSVTSSLPQKDEGEYVFSIGDLELAANRKGLLKEDGFVAYYDESGRLAEDTALFGVGSVDDFLNGTLSVTGEFDGSHLNAMEVLLETNKWKDLKLKMASCMALFGSDMFVDAQFSRIADFFIGEKVPKWLKEPGGPARWLADFERWLADGTTGVIPEMREAMRQSFGADWRASHPDDWHVAVSGGREKKRRRGKGRRTPRRTPRKSPNNSARFVGPMASLSARQNPAHPLVTICHK